MPNVTQQDGMNDRTKATTVLQMLRWPVQDERPPLAAPRRTLRQSRQCRPGPRHRGTPPGLKAGSRDHCLITGGVPDIPDLSRHPIRRGTIE